MSKVNLVVMGKTGAGKSTLINAVLEEDLAPTGSGQAVTKENYLYSKNIFLPLETGSAQEGQYRSIKKTVNLYDTVGLEIDSNVTHSTLQEIKDFIEKANKNGTDKDLSMVWFCVNCRSSRFESFEIDLIHSLSIEYEIPFVIVITQCYSDAQGDLEKQIRADFPEIMVARVLAKDYKLRSGIIHAYGITELLQTSVLGYDKAKVHILESKLDKLSMEREKRIEKLKSEGQKCIESYTSKAEKIGFIPGGCIPIVHGLCISLISSLNKIVGINSSEGFSSEIFTNALLGVVATPFMVVPLLSAAVAYAYVSTVGETYLDALMCVIHRSTDAELNDNELMVERITNELKNRKK